MGALTFDMRQTSRTFFHWWITELGSLVPAGIKRALLPADAAVVLRVEETEVFVSIKTKDGPQEIGRLRTTAKSDDAIAFELREILKRHQVGQSRAELVLAGGLVLERSVDLPLDAAENLKEVLAFEMDRLTPFSREEVYYDYRVTGSDPDLKRLRVAIVIARRSEVDRLTAWATSADLEPVSASALSTVAEGDVPLNLLPFKVRRASANWLGRAAMALLAALVILVGAALYLPLKKGERDLELAAERIGRLRVIAAEVADLDQRLAALQDKRQFISAEKLNRMPSIELLDEVTRRLPDSSWLLQFTFREEDLRVAGYADDPSQLIRLLEQSPVLSDVRFASPVTRDPRVEKDRFNLSAHVALRRER
jgi:general secretion pathway protein L